MGSWMGKGACCRRPQALRPSIKVSLQKRKQLIGRPELALAKTRWHNCFDGLQLLGEVCSDTDLRRGQVREISSSALKALRGLAGGGELFEHLLLCRNVRFYVTVSRLNTLMSEPRTMIVISPPGTNKLAIDVDRFGRPRRCAGLW